MGVDPEYPDLPASVVARAKEVCCMRCGEQIAGSKSMVGTVMFNYYAPAVGVRRRGALCGACGLLLREFLVPGLVDDPEYVNAMQQLRSHW